MTEDRIHRSAAHAFLLRAAALAVVAAAISIVWAVYFRGPNLRFDENYYYPLAENILAGKYEDGYVIRGPMYPLFLAGVFKVFGTGFLPALIVQGILRGLVVAMVAWLGRRYVSGAAGLVAAVVLTFSPALLSTYMSFLTEVVYVPLFLVSFYFVEKASQSERISGSLGAGLASGAAALARSTSFFLAILLAVWFAVGKSRTGRLSRHNMIRAAILVVALFAAISPWTIRNAVVYRGFIPIGDDSAFNLWLITSGVPIKEATREWASWGTHPERQREAYRLWRAYLREDPAFHVKRLGVVLPRLFSTSWESPVPTLSTVYRGEQPRSVPAVKRALTVLHAATLWLTFAGGLVGLLALERNGRRRTLVLLVVAFFVLIHGATLARSRFMLPAACLLSIYSGALISFGVEQLRRLRGRRPRRQGLVLLGAVASFFAAAVAAAAAPVVPVATYKIDHAPLQVHDGSDGWAEYPQCAVTPSVVVLAYSLKEGDRSEVHYQRIVRGSMTVGEPLPIDDGDRNQFEPCVGIMDDRWAWAAWASYGSEGWRIEGLVDDLSAPSQQVAFLEVYGGDGFNSQVEVDCGYGGAWFVWVNWRGGVYRILARRMVPPGLAAGEAVTIHESENPLARPDILVLGEASVLFAWDEYADMQFGVRTRELRADGLGPIGDFPASGYANQWEPRLAHAGSSVLVSWQAVPGGSDQCEPRAATLPDRTVRSGIARPDDDETWRVRCCDYPGDRAFLVWATRSGYRSTKLFVKAASGQGLSETAQIEFRVLRTFVNWFDCQYDGRLVLVYEAGGSVYMYDVDAARLARLTDRMPADTLAAAPPAGPVPEPRITARYTTEYEGAPLNLYFGDYHNHTSFSDGRAYPDISYLLARDVRGLDFMGVSDHDNTTTPGEFAWNCEVCDCLTRDGEYVCLYGHELSFGWAQQGFGHWNVLMGRKGPMVHYEEGMTPDDLYGYVRAHDLIAIPHHVGVIWAPHSWDRFDPVAEPVVEICSIHGIYENTETCGDSVRCVKGSMVADGLARGYHFGVVGGSDFHNCFTACLYECSLTGVYAEELTRGSVLDALRRRRTYATTGSKIVLDFRCNGKFMGEELSADGPLHFTAFMKSEEPILRAEVVGGGSVVISEDVGSSEASCAWDRANPGEATYFYLRVITQSGERAWSSPIYLVP